MDQNRNRLKKFVENKFFKSLPIGRRDVGL